MTPHELLPIYAKLKRPIDAHKGTFGTVLIIGGAPGMTGGLILSGLGALYSGAGITQLLSLNPHAPALIASHPELMVSVCALSPHEDEIAERHPSVIAIGPGLGQSERALRLLRTSLDRPEPLVLDADALNLIASHRDLLESLRSRQAETVLTPHPGEAARLLQCTRDDIQGARPEALEALVKLTGGVVLLKGQGTLVRSPVGALHHSQVGNPGMASGGMGDVLTGVIAALLAQGLSAWEATVLGQELHGGAADRCVARGKGPIGLTASELTEEIRAEINTAITACR